MIFGKIKSLFQKEWGFLFVSLILAIGLGTFNFWMAYPGIFLGGDTVYSLFLGKDNWHPVIISYLLEGLYYIFGLHTWCYLLLEIVPFYLGLFSIVWGCRQKFHSVKSLLLLFPAFIGNIFFLNFHLQSTTFSPNCIFLFYSLVLYQIFVPKSGKKWKFLTGMVFMVALLSRHNALFAVWPAFLIWIFSVKENKKFSFLKTIIYILGSVFLTFALAIIIPKALQRGQSYPYNHILLHQMAGACVPSNDSTCFPKEWYIKGRTWKDAKIIYVLDPINVDWLSAPFNKMTNIGKTNVYKYPIEGVFPYWLSAITKHPKDYIRYLWNFSQEILFQKYELQLLDTLHFSFEYLNEPYFLESEARLTPFLMQVFPISEFKKQFTPIQDDIFVWLYWSLPIIQPIYFISFVFIWGVISLFMLLKYGYNKFLLFSFSTALGGMGMTFIICVFSPIVVYRYIHSTLIMSILSFVGFMLYLCDKYIGYRKSILDKGRSD